MVTSPPIELHDGYASYRLTGVIPLRDGIELMGNAIAHCCTNGIARLLIDVSEATGYDPLSIWDRYQIGDTLAARATRAITVAMVAREESIDPQRFGMTVAQNRGLHINVFSSEAEALHWLLASSENYGEPPTK